MDVRVKIAALCVVVTESDSTAESDIGWSVSHSLVVQGGLELGRHEAIALAWIREAEEVNSKHDHIEGDWDDDQAEDTCEEMLEPQPWSDIPSVSKENP